MNTKNAKPCKKCKNAPIAIVKTPAHTDRDGIERDAVIEVGCIFCWPELVEDEGGQEIDLGAGAMKAKRVSYSARGLSLEDAEAKWNKGQFVSDYYFDRCPMTFGEITVQPK